MRWQSLSIRGDRQFETNGNVTLEPVGIEVDHTRFKPVYPYRTSSSRIWEGELKEYAKNEHQRYDRDIHGYRGERLYRNNAGTGKPLNLSVKVAM
jgi:hypothetical protein